MNTQTYLSLWTVLSVSQWYLIDGAQIWTQLKNYVNLWGTLPVPLQESCTLEKTLDQLPNPNYGARVPCFPLRQLYFGTICWLKLVKMTNWAMFFIADNYIFMWACMWTVCVLCMHLCSGCALGVCSSRMECVGL